MRKNDSGRSAINESRTSGEGTKKGKADYIAPLRPPTLAAIKPWGNSEGAGRVRLSRCKDKQHFGISKTLLIFYFTGIFSRTALRKSQHLATEGIFARSSGL